MAEGRRDGSANEQQGKASPAAPPANQERRGALRMLVTLGGLAYAGSIAVPAARFAVAPSEGRGAAGARWFKVGRLADLPEGEPQRIPVIGDQRDAFTVSRDQMLGSVWVMRTGDGVRAFTATCPHLGCSVDLNADKKSFGCPCHASRFNLEGTAEAGPSPRAMDLLNARVVNGVVEVDYRRYRQGISEREEVSA
jgi:menaquinol-cytochrome c reductase iron-sulfur subunit